MPRVPGKGLQLLRRNRRPLGWIMAAILIVALGDSLGKCLAMYASTPAAAPLAAMSEQPMVPGTMPCADCSAGVLEDDSPAVPAGFKPWFVLTLVVVGALLAFERPKSVPIPPRPLLPKRPRTLEFCVLRI